MGRNKTLAELVINNLLRDIFPEYENLIEVTVSYEGSRSYVHLIDKLTLNALAAISVKDEFSAARIILDLFEEDTYSNVVPVKQLNTVRRLNTIIRQKLDSFYEDRMYVKVMESIKDMK